MMNVSGVRQGYGGGETCRYKLGGECQLYSADVSRDSSGIMSEYAERLLHMNGCQEEIIALQKEIIDDLFALLSQHISVDCEEVKAVTAKINEAATIRADYQL